MDATQLVIAWLSVGVFLFATELLVPGVGLMFTGLGALTTGMLLNFSLIPSDNYMFQIVVFLGSSAVWTFLLWKPIKKARFGKKRRGYNNIVGEIAIVGRDGLDKTSGGEVKWSGTLMRAKLSQNVSSEYIEPETPVRIEDVVGNVLIVTPQI